MSLKESLTEVLVPHKKAILLTEKNMELFEEFESDIDYRVSFILNALLEELRELREFKKSIEEDK